MSVEVAGVGLHPFGRFDDRSVIDMGVHAVRAALREAHVQRGGFQAAFCGTAYGGVFFIACIGMGLGSYAGGAIHDLLGTYQWLFLGSFAIGVMAVVLGMTLRPAALPAARPSPATGG